MKEFLQKQHLVLRQQAVTQHVESSLKMVKNFAYFEFELT